MVSRSCDIDDLTTRHHLVARDDDGPVLIHDCPVVLGKVGHWEVVIAQRPQDEIFGLITVMFGLGREGIERGTERSREGGGYGSSSREAKPSKPRHCDRVMKGTQGWRGKRGEGDREV